MDATQNDLSFNQADIDYQALITTAQVAVTRLSDAIQENLNKIFHARRNNEQTAIYVTSRYIAADAERLQVACETLATLLAGVERENIRIVNKPVNEKKEG